MGRRSDYPTMEIAAKHGAGEAGFVRRGPR